MSSFCVCKLSILFLIIQISPSKFAEHLICNLLFISLLWTLNNWSRDWVCLGGVFGVGKLHAMLLFSDWLYPRLQLKKFTFPIYPELFQQTVLPGVSLLIIFALSKYESYTKTAANKSGSQSCNWLPKERPQYLQTIHSKMKLSLKKQMNNLGGRGGAPKHLYYLLCCVIYHFDFLPFQVLWISLMI